MYCTKKLSKYKTLSRILRSGALRIMATFMCVYVWYIKSFIGIVTFSSFSIFVIYSHVHLNSSLQPAASISIVSKYAKNERRKDGISHKIIPLVVPSARNAIIFHISKCVTSQDVLLVRVHIWWRPSERLNLDFVGIYVKYFLILIKEAFAWKNVAIKFKKIFV